MLYLTSISSFLLTLSSSINFCVYCVMCTKFRAALREEIKKFFRKGRSAAGGAGRGSQASIDRRESER